MLQRGSCKLLMPESAGVAIAWLKLTAANSVSATASLLRAFPLASGRRTFHSLARQKTAPPSGAVCIGRVARLNNLRDVRLAERLDFASEVLNRHAAAEHVLVAVDVVYARDR